MTVPAMEQVVTGNSANYEVHFLDSDDPIHDLTIMSVNPPTYYGFRTPIGYRDIHTIVRVDPPPSDPSRPLPVSAQATCD